MVRWRDLFKEDLKKSFGVWERHEAMSVLITLVVTAIISLFTTIGIKVASDLNIHGLIGLGIVIWFVLLVFIITPLRMLKDKADKLTQLTTKRLNISLAPNYEPGDGSHWLRLRVDNLSSLPVAGCYGKACSYTMLIQGKRLNELEKNSGLNQGLPPERHPFPWSPVDLPETITTIAGRGHEYLYIAVIQTSHWFTPTDMGRKYPKRPLDAEYEVILEVGSEQVAFAPTRVLLVFKVDINGQYLEAKEISTLLNSDMEGSQN